MEQFEERLQEVEAKLEKALALIQLLQQENSELQKKVDSADGFKRPASLAGLEAIQSKRLKLVTPMQAGAKGVHSEPEVVDRTDSLSKEKSEERRNRMQQLLKDFKNTYRPRYQDHLNEERQKCPRLRSKDGTIIKEHIKYIR